MCRMRDRIYIAIAFLWLLAGTSAWAQTATIGGHVADQDGAVLQGASVQVVSEDGSVKRDATTNVEGAYSFPLLSAGRYRILVNTPGFANVQSELIPVVAGQNFVFDIKLQVATENTNVTVSATEGAGGIELETGSLSTTLSTQEIAGYGLNGRNFSQLISMAPGVSNQTGQDEAKVGVAGSAKFSVNGGRVEYNTFEVDGSDVLNTSINASRGQGEPLIVYPSIDAIQDIQVLTSNYNAQYGKSASGSVLVTTKSGTADFHGNGYEFLRNEVFNARNYFDVPIQEPNGLLKKRTPLYRRQDFGFTLGGPLYVPNFYNTRKEKTFFFFSEEVRLEKTPVDYNQAVPTAAERSGNFSDVCPPYVPGASNYFNPASYPDCPYDRTNNNSGQGFAPGRAVVVSDIGGAIVNTGIIPAPNSTFGCNSTATTPLPHCYDASVSPSTYWREELFRIDQNINASNQLSFRYIHDAWNTTTLTPQWGIVQNSFPTVENRLDGPGLDLVLSVAQSLPHGLLNRPVLSYAIEHITLTPQPGPGLSSLERPAALDNPCAKTGSGTQAIIDCPMGYIFYNSANPYNGNKMPGLVFQGTNGAYGGHGFAADTGYAPWSQDNPTYTARDDASKSLGKHLLQFGVSGAYVQQNELSAANGANSGDPQGLLTFSNEQSLYTSGNAFADFLAGPGAASASSIGTPLEKTAIKSYTQDSGQARYHDRYQMVELYLQDDWHVTSHLTINAGFRASFFGNWYNPDGTAFNWRPEAYNASTGASIFVDPNYGYLVHTTPNSSGAAGSPVTLPNRNGPFSLGNLDPAITNGLVQCGKNGVSDSCMKSHPFNPAPRIGFSWDPFGDGKTAIRGGFGIFWEHGTGSEANSGSLIGSAPTVLSETQSNVPTPSGQSFGAYNLIGYSCQDSKMQCGSYASSASAVTFPLNVTSIPTQVVYSYTQQWSLGIQHEIRKDLVGQAAYVGTRGTHLTAVRDLNQLPPLGSGLNPFAAGQPITASVCNSGAVYNYFNVAGSNATGQTGIASSSGIGPTSPGYINMIVACTGNPGFDTAAAGSSANGRPLGISADAVRPYAGFSNVISIDNIASSRYDSFQGTLRETTGPLTLGVSYTYSHSLDDASDRSSANFADSLNLRSNHASSDFDQRHLLNVSYLWDLPILKALEGISHIGGSDTDSGDHSKAGAADTIPNIWHTFLDHWQVSGITAFQTGTPFSVINGGGADGTGEGDNAGVGDGLGIGSYVDVIGGAHGIKPVVSQSASNIGPLLLNPSAFSAPRGLSFGNSGRNYLRNPSRVNFNLSLLKHFKPFKEKTDVEFRAEAFNIFNHTQFRIYDASHPGNSGNNVANCYGDISTGYSAGATGCLVGNSFLHPVDAHDPRILQFGLKGSF